MDKFERTGSVLDDNEGRTGRPVTVNTPENVERVRELYEREPTISQVRASQRLQIKRTSLRTIMSDQLNLFPYKIQIYQALTLVDFQRRLDFANQVIPLLENGTIDLEKLWFSDEAHFYLAGYVNKQNFRHWGTENPHLVVACPLHPERVTVWCGLCAKGIIGPIFLDSTITGTIYKTQIIDEFMATAMGSDMVENYWFQQDGALPHRTQEVFDTISEYFGDRIIGLGAESATGGVIDWPSNSPDLNVCDTFLWGYLKDRVYATAPASIEDLKQRISALVQSIGTDILERAIGNFETRLRHLIVTGGAHFENLIH